MGDVLWSILNNIGPRGWELPKPCWLVANSDLTEVLAKVTAVVK